MNLKQNSTKQRRERNPRKILCFHKIPKLFGLVSILEQYGNQLREPYSKPLGDGIFELRAKVGTDISRVLYFFYYEGRIVLTHGFVKKTKKTPPSEIEYAKKCRKAFLERSGE